jgi:hypothetical protein
VGDHFLFKIPPFIALEEPTVGNALALYQVQISDPKRSTSMLDAIQYPWNLVFAPTKQEQESSKQSLEAQLAM